MSRVVRVATLNLLNDPSRWDERRRLIVEGFASLAPDLIALQEVVDPRGGGTARRLADELGGYAALACPQAGRGRPREGIAILSRWPICEHATLDLRSQRRTAQRVRVDAGPGSFFFVNGHFHWPPTRHASRLRQVGRLLDWLRADDDGTPAVVCGDFNALPGSPAVAAMSRAFDSAHTARHGREPDWTCPTPLVTGNRAFRMLKSAMLRGLTNRPGESWRGTLDYIFVDRRIRVLDCRVALDRPAPHDPTLYASDHLGLAATLEIPPGDGDRDGS